LESFTINKSQKQLMIFNLISKTIKDPDNIEGSMRAKNTDLVPRSFRIFTNWASGPIKEAVYLKIQKRAHSCAFIVRKAYK
jgi:hypothetical protein